MKLTTEQLLFAHRIVATHVRLPDGERSICYYKNINAKHPHSFWLPNQRYWYALDEFPIGWDSNGVNEIDFSPLYTDWIDHDGGECPVREDDFVIVLGDSGNQYKLLARELDWSAVKHFKLYRSEDWPEWRSDVIGQNANEGEHYAGVKAEAAVKAYTDVQSYIEEQAVKRSKYHREIAPGVWVDVYDVLKAWQVTCPALQHLIKKALQPGERGHKTLDQDMKDIVASAIRAQELASKPQS